MISSDIMTDEDYLAGARYMQNAQMVWRSIDTAPKDGTPVLVADMNVWMTAATFLPCDMCWVEHTASGLKLNDPTHWMPLPAPPGSFQGLAQPVSDGAAKT